MRGDTEAKEHLVVLGMLTEAFLHGPEALNAVGALFLLFAVQKAFVPALPPGEEARDEEKESQQARPRALKESIPRLTAHRTLGVSLGRSAPTARHGDQRDAARHAPLPTAASAGEWGTHATTKLGPQGPSFMWAMHGHSSGSPS